MAHVLSLVREGETISLSTTNFLLVRYTPRPPEMVPLAEIGTGQDVEAVGDVYYRHVTETIELYATAASKTALQDVVRSVERMLHEAQLRQRRGDGLRVYLRLQVDGEANVWRSEILAAQLEMADNALAVYANIGFEARLHLTRRPFWEYGESSPIAIQLSSSSDTTPTTGPVTITNDNDANWVQIASSQITGAVPAPVKLDIEHSGANSNYNRFWILSNARTSPSTLDPYLLGTESVGGSATVNGSNMTFGAAFMRWQVPDALLDLTKGAFVRAMLAFSSAFISNGDAQYWGRVEYGLGGTYYTLWEGPVVDHETNINDLGLFPLPPGGVTAGYTNIYFSVAARCTGTFQVTVDHLLLLPVDSERQLRPVFGFVLTAGDALVEDGIEGESYVENASGDRSAILIGRGGPVWLYPNKTQRLYLFGTTLGGGYPSTRSNKVRAWYRPRRLTI